MLATLTLLTPALDLLLPIGRFGGLISPVVASVLLPTGRDHAALHAVTGQIRELGGHAHPVVAELTDPDQSSGCESRPRRPTGRSSCSLWSPADQAHRHRSPSCP
jgi:hypothetical protein